MRGLEGDEHEDLVAAVKDNVRFEAGDRERRQRLEGARDVRLAAA
jgi:hypothetical protein